MSVIHVRDLYCTYLRIGLGLITPQNIQKKTNREIVILPQNTLGALIQSYIDNQTPTIENRTSCCPVIHGKQETLSLIVIVNYNNNT